MLAAQHLVGRTTPSAALRVAVRVVGVPAIAHWAFEHYLAIAPPEFAAHAAWPGASAAARRTLSHVPATSGSIGAMRPASSG